MKYLKAFLLAALLLPVAMSAHEVMHAVIWWVLGVKSVVLVRTWTLQFPPVTLPSLHAARPGPGGLGGPDVHVPLLESFADNLLGPLIVAAVLAVLRASIGRTSQVARAALLAVVAVLVFFGVLEGAYPLVYAVADDAASVLLLPELNYGGALLVMLVALGVSLRPRRPRAARVPVVEGRAVPPTPSAL